MGLHVELEFEKYCKVVQTPKVGWTSHLCRSRTEERTEKGKPTTRDYLIRNVDDDFTEISFNKSRSSSYKNMCYGPVASNETLKRDPVYQCSKEVKQMKKAPAPEERRKIEFSPGSDASLSFRIFDSSSRPEIISPLVYQKESSILSLDDEPKQLSVSKTFPQANPPDLMDLSFRFPATPACITPRNLSSEASFATAMDSEDGKHCPAGKVERASKEQLKFRCDQTIGPPSDGNNLLNRDTFRTLHKSSSEKVGMPYSHRGQESDHCKSSGKARFSPFRRMFDPIMKSKSLRSSPVSRAELGCATTIGSKSVKRSRTLRKSLLNDFSNTAHKTELGGRSAKKDQQSSVLASSPTHLHGRLTLELKHGVPYFEFFLKDTEDVLSSKTWKANNAFNWVYTFHSMNSSRTSNSNGRGVREKRNESSIVGQMQVSCFFLSEMRHSGGFNNSLVTEFVLYDIMHARRAMAAKDSSYNSASPVKPIKVTTGESPPSETNNLSDALKNRLHPRDASDNDNFDASTHYPWAPVDLHPNLEVAAIVIQVPFEKRESLKEKRGDKLGGKDHLNLFEFSAIDQKLDDVPNNSSSLKVVTPTGTHGLPSKTEDGSPSPLLDRWRSGGRCDCGGWDMACPLVVLDNLGVQNMVDQPFMDNQRHIELFFQGSKEKTPALTITFISEGEYSVYFHARLSKLQAFSICVAVLHGSEASTAAAQEENKQRLPCNSLKMLLDDEVRFLIGAVAEKEKRKLAPPNSSPFARS